MRASPGDRASALVRTLHGGLDRLLFFLHYAKAQTADRGLPLGTRLDLLRHGFLPSSGRLYRSMTPASRGDYLADYPRYCRTPFINGDYRFCLDDKAVFGGLLQRYPDHAPRTLAAIYRGRLLPVRNVPGGAGRRSRSSSPRTPRWSSSPPAGRAAGASCSSKRRPAETSWLAASGAPSPGCAPRSGGSTATS